MTGLAMAFVACGLGERNTAMQATRPSASILASA
jgi:hypothetical protein